MRRAIACECFHFGVRGGVAGVEDAVLAAGDDLAVLGYRGVEGAASALFDRLGGQSHRLYQELALPHGATSAR